MSGRDGEIVAAIKKTKTKSVYGLVGLVALVVAMASGCSAGSGETKATTKPASLSDMGVTFDAAQKLTPLNKAKDDLNRILGANADSAWSIYRVVKTDKSPELVAMVSGYDGDSTKKHLLEYAASKANQGDILFIDDTGKTITSYVN